MQQDLFVEAGMVVHLGDRLVPAPEIMRIVSPSEPVYVRVNNIARRADPASPLMETYTKTWIATQAYRVRLQRAYFQSSNDLTEEIATLKYTTASDSAETLAKLKDKLRMAVQRESTHIVDFKHLLTPVNVSRSQHPGNAQKVAATLNYILEDPIGHVRALPETVRCGDEYTFRLDAEFLDAKYDELVGRTAHGPAMVRLVTGVHVVADCTVDVYLPAHMAARLGDMCTPCDNFYKLHFDQLIVGVEITLFQLQPDNRLVPYTPTHRSMYQTVDRLDVWVPPYLRIECPTGETAWFATCSEHAGKLAQLALSPIMLLADDLNVKLWQKTKILTPTDELKVLDKDDEMLPHGYTQAKFDHFVINGTPCNVIVFSLRL